MDKVQFFVMKLKKIQPEDYIINFSPNVIADLYVEIENSSRPTVINKIKSNFTTFIKQFISKYLKDPNEYEVDKVIRLIFDKWVKVTPQAIETYLVERFWDDHLRKFEYAFLARCLSDTSIKKDTIVDIGGGSSYSTVVPMLFSFSKTRIFSIDVTNHQRNSKYGVVYIKGDCIKTNLPNEFADFISIISTLEHIGLGRYGDPLDVDGDVKAMREAYRILKPHGYLVVTIPYGYPTVVYNLHRVYDYGRLSLLTKGFKTIKAEYSLLGKSCTRMKIEGKKVTKKIAGFYQNIPERSRHYDTQEGILLLLQKR